MTDLNTNLLDFTFPPNSSLSRLLSINAKASHDPQLLLGLQKPKANKNENRMHVIYIRSKSLK